jgi:large subunit ribosomal protein L29
MNTSELRKLSDQELAKELVSLLRTQFGLRMQKATQQLGNTNQISTIRRDIARVKTIISQKVKEI